MDGIWLVQFRWGTVMPKQVKNRCLVERTGCFSFESLMCWIYPFSLLSWCLLFFFLISQICSTVTATLFCLGSLFPLSAPWANLLKIIISILYLYTNRCVLLPPCISNQSFWSARHCFAQLRQQLFWLRKLMFCWVYPFSLLSWCLLFFFSCQSNMQHSHSIIQGCPQDF